MLDIVITEKGGQPQPRQFDQPEITIGRIQGNDIVLPKSNISKQHARIVQNAGTLVVIDSKSTNGTYVNGQRIGAPQDLESGDRIYIGDFTLEISFPQSHQSAGGAHIQEERRQAQTQEFSNNPQQSALSADPQGEAWPEEEAAANAPQSEPVKETPAWQQQWAAPPSEVSEKPAASARGTISNPSLHTDAMQEEAGPHQSPSKRTTQEAQEQSNSQSIVLPEELGSIIELVHEKLRKVTDFTRQDINDSPEIHAEITASVHGIISELQAQGKIPPGTELDLISECVLGEVIGLGPLEDLLADPSVTEILVNNARQIFIERRGKLEPCDMVFSCDLAVIGVIERIVAPLGRRIDSNSPMVDARLRDGSRVNAIIPPLAVKGPTLTIRKFMRTPLQIDDLVASGTLSAEMAEFLEMCVKARKNMVVSGGTGSGKTTLLNVLSSFIGPTERIITIEDAAELKLDQQHVVSLESRPPSIDGPVTVTIRDLVRNALRMRPDRIIVGECRGGEALDMLQAMNTGHDGSLTTIHANGPREALARMETLVLLAGMELPARTIREQVASALNIVVQQARFADGSRRITHISEITGMEGEVISMHDLFVYEQQGVGADGRIQGRFRATGFIPKFYESLRGMGIKVNLAIFRNN